MRNQGSIHILFYRVARNVITSQQRPAIYFKGPTQREGTFTSLARLLCSKRAKRSTIDSQTGILQRSAICVQRFDDSRKAIHITYRISLRSSSLREPRDPLSKVVSIYIDVQTNWIWFYKAGHLTRE